MLPCNLSPRASPKCKEPNAKNHIVAVLGRWFDQGKSVQNYQAWQARLRQVNLPVLIMWGTRDDFFTTPGAVAYLRDAPKARGHIFDDGHFATLDQPEVVSPLLGSFLAEYRNELMPAGR